MNWLKIFLRERGFTTIVVTGPQRSGTTFMAYAISYDIGWPYADEAVFNIDDRKKFNDLLLFRERNIVVQAPGMMRWIDEYGLYKDILFIVMIRAVEDIVKSEVKRRWGFRAYEIKKYLDLGATLDIPISKTKYEYFEKNQRQYFKGNLLLVKYPEDVRDHPLFVPDKERVDWTIKQVNRKQRWVPVDMSLAFTYLKKENSHGNGFQTTERGKERS